MTAQPAQYAGESADDAFIIAAVERANVLFVHPTADTTRDIGRAVLAAERSRVAATQPAAASESVDTPEFQAVLHAYRNSRLDFAETRAALIAYIHAWHAANKPAAPAAATDLQAAILALKPEPPNLADMHSFIDGFGKCKAAAASLAASAALTPHGADIEQMLDADEASAAEPGAEPVAEVTFSHHSNRIHWLSEDAQRACRDGEKLYRLAALAAPAAPAQHPCPCPNVEIEDYGDGTAGCKGNCPGAPAVQPTEAMLAEMSEALERVAQGWDGCMYDAAHACMLDVGKCLREAFVSLPNYLRQVASPIAAVPEGWKMVPVTLTEEMHVAAVRAIVRSTGNDDFPPAVWAAMLTAAPAPTTREG